MCARRLNQRHITTRTGVLWWVEWQTRTAKGAMVMLGNSDECGDAMRALYGQAAVDGTAETVLVEVQPYSGRLRQDDRVMDARRVLRHMQRRKQGLLVDPELVIPLAKFGCPVAGVAPDVVDGLEMPTAATAVVPPSDHRDLVRIVDVVVVDDRPPPLSRLATASANGAGADLIADARIPCASGA